VENCFWSTRYRGPLLIHASKSPASYKAQNPDRWRERYGIELPAWDHLVKGAIIGVIELVDCFHDSERVVVSAWTEGPWQWLLADPRPFPEPIPFRGLQQLFMVPDTLIPQAFH